MYYFGSTIRILLDLGGNKLALKPINMRLDEVEYEKLKIHLEAFGDRDINIAYPSTAAGYKPDLLHARKTQPNFNHFEFMHGTNLNT
jgi:hypothetical protein